MLPFSFSLHSSSPTSKFLSMASYVGELLLDSLLLHFAAIKIQEAQNSIEEDPRPTSSNRATSAISVTAASLSSATSLVKSIGILEDLLPEPWKPHPAVTICVHIPHVPHHLLLLLHFLCKTQKMHQNDISLHIQDERKLTGTSTSSWMGVSMSLERELRVADQRS